MVLFRDFSEFVDLLRSLPASEFASQRSDFAAKASISGRIVCECLIEQEKVNKKLVEDHRRLSRNFKLSRAANSDLEKKVSELAEALKKCQDEKKIAEEAAENSRKELEKLRKTHDDDLRMIENLRKDHDKSLKTAEDLRTNNANLAKSLSSKDQKIQDLERALTEQKEASGKKVSDIINKLKLLFEEYEKSLNEFGVRLAPLPADLGLLEFMEWIEAEFKALPDVISGANDFAATFFVESILKLLHDFDCADLTTFREKLSQFPDALSTSRIWPNEDAQAIRSKFAREFWLADGKEAVKSITRAKLAQVSFRTVLLATANSQNFVFHFFLPCFLCLS
jgi:myosin heavy subunit